MCIEAAFFMYNGSIFYVFVEQDLCVLRQHFCVLRQHVVCIMASFLVAHTDTDTAQFSRGRRSILPRATLNPPAGGAQSPRGHEGHELVIGVEGRELVIGVEGPELVIGVEGSEFVFGVEEPELVIGVEGPELVIGVEGRKRVKGVEGPELVTYRGWGARIKSSRAEPCSPTR